MGTKKILELDGRGPRIVYEGLKQMSGPGWTMRLNLSLHRYVAIVKHGCVGRFSNLEMAFGAVDGNPLSGPLYGAWEAGPWQGQDTYVQDTKTGQMFLRVRVTRGKQGAGMAEGAEEPEKETGEAA